jgi:hypothetical protein
MFSQWMHPKMGFATARRESQAEIIPKMLELLLLTRMQILELLSKQQLIFYIMSCTDNV